MSTLAQQSPSPILEHEADLRKAFQLIAPDQEKVIDAIKEFGDFRQQTFIEAEEHWRSLAREFNDIKEACKQGPIKLDQRWSGDGFDKFKGFVHTEDPSIHKAAEALAKKATAIADGLKETNELYRVTWEELGNSTAAIIGTIVGGALGAVLGSAVPGVGTVAIGALGAAVGALVTIIVQVGFDAISAHYHMGTALDNFIEFVASDLKLPEHDLTKGGYQRDTVQVIDR